MASFDFVVDTSPMAASISDVKDRVSQTTAAVVAMQAAVIAAEQAAAEKLCEDIDNGFYCLMQSQLSMKRTEHFSTLRTKFLSLQELGKDLCSKQQRMEQDVARIQREYYRLFHSIDKSLEKQVRELDADAYKYVDQREYLITSRQLRDISEVLCYEKDTATVARTALTAKLKKRTRKTLESVGDNISQNQVYQDRMQEVLNPAYTEAPVPEYIPVVYVQESSMVTPDVQVCEVLPPDSLDKSVKDSVSTAVSGMFSELTREHTSEADKNRVRAAFQNIMSSANLDARIAGTMMNLFERGGYR